MFTTIINNVQSFRIVRKFKNLESVTQKNCLSILKILKINLKKFCKNLSVRTI